MRNKKQIVAVGVLTLFSIAFVVCCLFLPLFYMKLCDFYTSEVVIEGNFSLVNFIKLGGNDDLFFSNLDASGPMWLTLATICFNILTIIGCAILTVLSILGLVFAIKGKNFSFKNSAVYKLAGFVGVFGIISFIAQIVGFIVLTSLANNLIFFYPIAGCFVNFVLAIAILVSSRFVKNKEGVLNKNKLRDSIFFGLTFALSVGLIIMLVCCTQFSNEISTIIWGEENLTFLNLSKMANDSTLNLAKNPFYGDVPLGVSFYAMSIVVIGLIFLAIYSIIGLIRCLCNKSTNWLSIRVKRWSRAILDTFAILFIFLMCSCTVLFSNIIFKIPELNLNPSCFSLFACIEFVVPFLLVVLTSFIGVYNNKEDKDIKVENNI